ncbi:hypothetical protein GOACH_07_00870 [Gordonia aichiensis NBRC 108223]|uniref:Uncharacterized protein n=1 Tax=Gordonia aichiensis NBRC 108223 TaxID=1220583 RepID=L7KM63_9ACTN|nr:hypothetical protein GOACH_07_00870 [Gordonia aichiensis NBRC 108223]
MYCSAAEIMVSEKAEIIAGARIVRQRLGLRRRIRGASAESDAQRGGGCDGQSGHETATLPELEPRNGHVFTNPWLEASSTL